MHMYNADLEAARREAPADIDWPDPDGHDRIPPVLNAPRGSPEHVHVCLRGKVEELHEEADASLRSLEVAIRQAKPSAFAEIVDATILAGVERVLGASFDPSTHVRHRHQPSQ
eukprot:jgi/Tetstr1/420803/TSEL_011879.t1